MHIITIDSSKGYKKIGNPNSVRLETFMLLLSTIIVTFGKSFISMII